MMHKLVMMLAVIIAIIAVLFSPFAKLRRKSK